MNEVSSQQRYRIIHSGQTTGHSRDLSTSGQFPSSSHKIPRSTSATRAISVLSSIILPLQTFFSRVLLLRQQPFSSENLPPERPTTTIAIKTQVFMFRYESVNSTRKFTLLKKIYKRDAPFRAVFKVKTLAVLFLAYPREIKHIPRNLNMPPFCRCLFLWKWCNPFPRARARLKHAYSFDRCGTGLCFFGMFRLSVLLLNSMNKLTHNRCTCKLINKTVRLPTCMMQTNNCVFVFMF